MTAFRCVGLLVVLLLGACDNKEPPVPAPKTQASQSAAVVPAAPAPVVVTSTVEKPVAQAVTGAADKQHGTPAHDLKPTAPVVPVVLDKSDFGVAAKPAEAVAKGKHPGKEEGKKPLSEKAAKAVAKASSKEQKAKADKSSVKNTRVGTAKLDLSLPPDLVRELEPPANVITGRRKPLLPPMFGDKAGGNDPTSFELNGRLLSNEMQLQMRNDSRRDVEGAALDFKFKQ